MSPLSPLHHLPRPAQNLPYLIALAVAPLINLAISINSFHHFQTLSRQQLPINHWIFGVSKFVLSGILILLIINLLRTLWLGHHQIRRTLLAFGLLSTLDLLLNLVTITAGIYSFKLGSFYLLLIALGLYCSLNLIFLFWYWFIDYPSQVRHLHQPQHLCQIIFPREAVSANAGWLPGCLDYLYFTVMTSNTLGAAGDRDLTGGEHPELIVREGHPPSAGGPGSQTSGRRAPSRRAASSRAEAIRAWRRSQPRRSAWRRSAPLKSVP